MIRRKKKNARDLFTLVHVCVSEERNSRHRLNDNLHIYDVNQLIDILWKYETHHH